MRLWVDHVKEIERTGLVGGALFVSGGLLFKFRHGDGTILRLFVLFPIPFRKVSA